ncbi:DUF1592 domain-containing protein [Crateriforma conspicua]|nr:DUF1592 domain-containing protein [Crateriforma conspicua]
MSTLVWMIAAGGGLAVADESDSHPQEIQTSSESDVEARWQNDGWELMERFCLDCHNDAFQEAELDLSGFDTIEGLMLEGNGMTAERVLNMVRFGAMPPEDYDVPTDGERKQLVQALDAAMYSVVCDLVPKPGKVTARRLNRAEYNHSVRDLFGMDLRPADAFPSDEVGGGFDNNGDVLSLSPMLMEKYLDAAISVADAVLVDPADLPRIDSEAAGDLLVVQGDGVTGSFYGRFITPESFVWTEFKVPADGKYRVQVACGMTREDDGPGRFGLFDSDGMLLGTFVAEYFGGGGSSQRESVTVHLTEGTHILCVAPLPGADDDAKGDANWKVGEAKLDAIEKLSKQAIRDGKKQFGKGLTPDRRFDRDRYTYMVRKIEVEGPSEFDNPVYPPSQWKILRKQPPRRRGGYRDVAEAARENMAPLLRRAFRGPVTDDDLDAYAALVKQATDRDESFVDGMRIAIAAMLVSPRFLFRIESPVDWETGNVVAQADEGVVTLSDHQLATRLAYFLWSSLPDDRLLDLADKGKLRDESVLKSEVKRMIRDPRSRSLASEFAAQWLGLRNLEGVQPDASRYAGFDEGLLPRMATETESLFMHLIHQNRPISELLTADYTFVDAALAKYYGLKDSKIPEDDFVKVTLADTPRRGVLGHASVLTLTSNPTRTSPVIRGKWILENILGTPPPEPPAGVPELEETATAGAEASLREQMEIHRADPACASCHRVMDQLGFGLENFDAVGRFRKMDGKFPVDSSGELPGGRTFNGGKELSELLGRSEQKSFAATAVRKLMTFALGRELTPQDRCVVDEIVAQTAADDYRLADLVWGVVNSRPFQAYEWTPNVTFRDAVGDAERK